MDLTGIDMNDPINLEYYTRLLSFKADESQSQVIFHGPDREHQSTLHTLAYKLDLEYGYSLYTLEAKVFRPLVLQDTSGLSDDVNQKENPLVDWTLGLIDFNTSERFLDPHPRPLPLTWPVDSSSASASESPLTYVSDHLTSPFNFDDGFFGSSDRRSSSAASFVDFSPRPHSVDCYSLESEFGNPSRPTSSKNIEDVSRREYQEANSLNDLFDFTFLNTAHINKEVRDHPLYQNVTAGSDGLYHCPWEGQPSCQHKPEKLKCNYDKLVDSHLRPYRCKFSTCENLQFSSTACLLRHEREAHAMHGRGEKPYLCQYDGCDRGLPGNGFPRYWNLKDHLRRARNISHVSNDPDSGLSKTAECDLSKAADFDLYEVNHQGLLDSTRTLEKLDAPNASSTMEVLKKARNYIKQMSLAVDRIHGIRPKADHTLSPILRPERSSWTQLEAAVPPEGASHLSRATSFSGRSQHSVTSSGRRGPLSNFARASMKAVKAVGACWKCKILRKQCNLETPCRMCPKTDTKSYWNAIGCKRGDLKSEMAPVTLCKDSNSSSIQIDGLLSKDQVNEQAKQALQDRDAALGSLTNLDGYLQELRVKSPALGNAFLPSPPNPSLSALSPLDDCVMAIVWESTQVSNEGFFTDCEFKDAIVLMRSASFYQAKLKSDELIAQSLICLRSSLEVIRMKAKNILTPSVHQACTMAVCEIECVSALNTHLTCYLDELSRVLFKKDNMCMRTKDWWLSVFYSLCIQAIVRKALLDLTDARLRTSHDNTDGIRKYLHLAVSLFVASSRGYDPLVQDVAVLDEAVTTLQDYELIRAAVGQSDWKAKGIQGSDDYLPRLFEIEGSIQTLPTDARLPFANESTRKGKRRRASSTFSALSGRSASPVNPALHIGTEDVEFLAR